jgi:hypothetical protein
VTIDPSVVIAAFGGLVTVLTAAVRLVYMDLRRDRDYWRDMALSLRDVNRKSIDVAAKVVDA